MLMTLRYVLMCHRNMVLVGIVMDMIEVGTLILGIMTGIVLWKQKE